MSRSLRSSNAILLKFSVISMTYFVFFRYKITRRHFRLHGDRTSPFLLPKGNYKTVRIIKHLSKRTAEFLTKLVYRTCKPQSKQGVCFLFCLFALFFVLLFSWDFFWGKNNQVSYISKCKIHVNLKKRWLLSYPLKLNLQFHMGFDRRFKKKPQKTNH